MNPFKFTYNLTDVQSGVTFPVRLSLTKGSWVKLTAWSLAPSLVLGGAFYVAGLLAENEVKETNTEDKTVDYPQYN